ncbi:MAG TPA: carboxypeptidase-like regulatory domain-containing protein, partial [Pyrinomonadaceae bacterium]|nr:carboxypeptidase-like regulatory domain-containing protein [Pyrinomonadaceae bacterium]
GRGIAQAQVIAISSNGEKRAVRSNSFGNFEIGQLQMGESYTLAASAKGFNFAPLTIGLTDNAVNVNIIAQ